MQANTRDSLGNTYLDPNCNRVSDVQPLPITGNQFGQPLQHQHPGQAHQLGKNAQANQRLEHGGAEVIEQHRDHAITVEDNDEEHILLSNENSGGQVAGPQQDGNLPAAAKDRNGTEK